MALVGVTGGTFGQGLRYTDSFGGCISFGEAPVGTDADFLGPLATILLRARKVNSGTFVGRCSAGFSDNLGGDKRMWLEVEANTPNTSSMQVRAKLNTTACGAITVHTYDLTKDTNEHSYAWTYNQAGNSVLYVDGTAVNTVAAPCADISGPSAATDKFTVWGSHTPGVEIYYTDNEGYSKEELSAAQMLDYHQNGFPGD